MQSAARQKRSKRYEFVTEEKSEGATYTPTHFAEFVASQIVAAAGQATKPIRVLDPAVGDGALLMSLLSRLQQHSKAPVSVYGFDTDAKALIEARRRLSATFPKATLHLEKSNFLQYVLRNTTTDQKSLFSEQPAEPFDLIIANPPYVRTQIMGAQQAQQLGAAFGLTGRVDLYHAFLIGIARVLQPHGVAGIIVSNRFMTTKGGASVRAALRDRFTLRHIWDLGDTKLFDAAVLPAVILAEGKNGQATQGPRFTSIYQTTEKADQTAEHPIAALSLAGNIKLPDERRFHVQHGTLDATGETNGVWRIATDAGDAWLSTVVAHSWGTFRDLGKIRVGVKTCADKVFIRSDWNELPPTQRPELLRPLTTHHGSGRFRAIEPKKHRQILYPHDVENGRRQAVNLSRYPKSRAYLEGHRTGLEARTYVIEGGRQWYEIWVPQDPAAWTPTKLVFRDISERPTFWLDLDGTIVNGDCYWLTPERAVKEDLLWLAAAVANSTFAEAFYDRRFNNKLYAGRRRFITQYVEQFPLPDPSTKLAAKIISIAKAIYDENHSPKAETLELQIDKLIWQAFGLPIKKISR